MFVVWVLFPDTQVLVLPINVSLSWKLVRKSKKNPGPRVNILQLDEVHCSLPLVKYCYSYKCLFSVKYYTTLEKEWWNWNAYWPRRLLHFPFFLELFVFTEFHCYTKPRKHLASGKICYLLSCPDQFSLCSCGKLAPELFQCSLWQQLWGISARSPFSGQQANAFTVRCHWKHQRSRFTKFYCNVCNWHLSSTFIA